MFRIYRVSGNSMQPYLNKGDYIVALNRFFSKKLRLKVGQVVIVEHPRLGVSVKRIAAIQNDKFELIGDGADTSSTADMGLIDKSQLLGKLLFRIKAK